ncbi:hypothetical protein IF1G_11389 [Cordyceps javanica]|uniref:Uncharacterized protein n=1 Tax=Cordyceps javanica TaxID=43265 RepID=A0A545UKG1_9HYPO|nr:hypothetical protein IF1G_11389 [Cordyceps javanica]
MASRCSTTGAVHTGLRGLAEGDRSCNVQSARLGLGNVASRAGRWTRPRSMENGTIDGASYIFGDKQQDLGLARPRLPTCESRHCCIHAHPVTEPAESPAALCCSCFSCRALEPPIRSAHEPQAWLFYFVVLKRHHFSSPAGQNLEILVKWSQCPPRKLLQAVGLWADNPSPRRCYSGRSMPRGTELSPSDLSPTATAVRTARGEEIVDFAIKPRLCNGHAAAALYTMGWRRLQCKSRAAEGFNLSAYCTRKPCRGPVP